MARYRDPALSEYVRFLILEKAKTGKEQLEIAKAAGIAKSGVSQVVSRKLGVGSHNGRGYAKAFGLTLSELITQADAWFAEQKKNEPSGREQSFELTKAISMVLRLGADRKEIDAIIEIYDNAAFRAREASWWVEILLREIDHRKPHTSGVLPKKTKKDDESDDSVVFGRRRPKTTASQ